MLTAFGREAELQQTGGVGIGSFLVKPAKRDLLMQTLAAAVSGQGSSRTARPAADGETPSRLRSAHVLLAEDNAVNQKFAAAILARAGVEVEIAADGAQALKAVEARTFDAVLMDVQMPEVDGLEATRRLRRLPVKAGLPVIAMTANVMQGDREVCLEAGMDDYIGKPIDPEELFAVLEKWIRLQPNNPPIQPVGQTAAEAPASNATAGPAGIDREELLERVGGDNKLLEMILAEFHRSFGDASRTLTEHLQQESWEQLERQAHTLKGAAANISAKGVYNGALELEAAARDADPARAAQALQRTSTALDEVLGL